MSSNEEKILYPICDFCGEKLTDWHGNIMVPGDDYVSNSPRRINIVKVMCKPCTIRLDDAGRSDDWHNIWELIWIKEDTLRYLGMVIANLISNEPGYLWAPKAVERVYELATMAHPELSQDVIGLP